MKQQLEIDFLTLKEEDSFFLYRIQWMPNWCHSKTVPKGCELKPSDVNQSASFLSASHLLVTATYVLDVFLLRKTCTLKPSTVVFIDYFSTYAKQVLLYLKYWLFIGSATKNPI